VLLRANEKSLSIRGPAGHIEAVAGLPDAEPTAAAVICHPHPLHHGTMNNKVVTTLARACEDIDAVALRFNFRGVGGSEGDYDGGAGELEDAKAVADWACETWPGIPLILAGFSFGGAIAVRLASERRPVALVTVAPAVDRIPADQLRPACEWLVIQGDRDDIVEPSKVFSRLDEFTPPPRIRLMDGAGHFFHGRLVELRGIVRDHLATAVAS